MTEKQIYRRMNEAYENFYGDRDEDEWYGDDDPKVWRFYRPSSDLRVKLVMVDKRVEVYEKVGDGYLKVGNYSW